MQLGDLVKGIGFAYYRYGYGIVTDIRYGSIAVFWPKHKSWSYVSRKDIKVINESR